MLFVLLLFPQIYSHGPMKVLPNENVVSISFVGKLECSNCGYFLEEQVLPTWKKLSRTGRFNMTYIPYSLCSRSGGFALGCASDVKALQACIVDQMVYGYWDLLFCTQYEKDLNVVLKNCDFSGLDIDRIKSCAGRGWKEEHLDGRWSLVRTLYEVFPSKAERV